jgi:hypothetical protein
MISVNQLEVSRLVDRNIAVQKFEVPADFNRFLDPFNMIISGKSIINDVRKNAALKLCTIYTVAIFVTSLIKNSLGPTLCGKTTFICNILKHRNQLLTTSYSRVVYFFPNSDVNSTKRLQMIDQLKLAYPKLEVQTGLPKPNDARSSHLPKLFIIGNTSNIKF